jgi:hypothetical protein
MNSFLQPAITVYANLVYIFPSQKEVQQGTESENYEAFPDIILVVNTEGEKHPCAGK